MVGDVGQAVGCRGVESAVAQRGGVAGEDVVEPETAGGLAEASVGAVVIGFLCSLTCIVHPAVVGFQELAGLAVALRIHVAGKEDHSLVAGYLLHLPDIQLGSLLTCRHATMVHVRAEIPEVPAGPPILQVHPDGYSAVAIPAFGNLLRGGAEPGDHLVRQFILVPETENRLALRLLESARLALSVVVVIGKFGIEIVQLRPARLLKPEHIGFFRAYHID